MTHLMQMDVVALGLRGVSVTSVGISLKELGGQRLGQSWGGLGDGSPPAGSRGRAPVGTPQKLKKHDMNFVLRITLIGA